MKMQYIVKKFSPKTLRIIQYADQIVSEYQELGYDLTLRQLYYQFVSRDIIPNRQSEYNRLSAIIGDARLAGLIDWNAIVDRTRGVRENSHWTSPAAIMQSALYSYAIDKRETQPTHVEVWIEKDALSEVIGGVCRENDVPYLSCRGYTSLSEMWRAGMRIINSSKEEAVIIHLGDHDPSGIDMTRDIVERLNSFAGNNTVVRIDRIALNFDQIKKYSPPPNPVKFTDTRAGGYRIKYGEKSWELDALEPTVITKLLQNAIDKYTDVQAYEDLQDIENEHKTELKNIIKNLEDKK